MSSSMYTVYVLNEHLYQSIPATFKISCPKNHVLLHEYKYSQTSSHSLLSIVISRNVDQWQVNKTKDIRRDIKVFLISLNKNSLNWKEIVIVLTSWKQYQTQKQYGRYIIIEIFSLLQSQL